MAPGFATRDGAKIGTAIARTTTSALASTGCKVRGTDMTFKQIFGLAGKQREEKLREALTDAPAIWEVLARPDSYKEWYDGQREDALMETGEK